MNKTTLLTGLRTNNALHIGNYLGAIRPLVSLINERSNNFEINLFLPDLHSFTTPIDHAKLYDTTINTVKFFYALGVPLDNPNIKIYRQSYIPAHSELTWILDCFTGIGELKRMTQYKDKSLKLSEDRVGVGLFNYPVLMAADILLYNALYVPVGDDQTQHLEFTRDIAVRMNNRFGEIFTVPEPVKKQHEFFGKTQGLRIMDLSDPTKKMSKSDDTGRGVIFLDDSVDDIRKKIQSATTDSVGSINYDHAKQPGITNLLDLLSNMYGSDLDGIIDKYTGLTQYGQLKNDLADVMIDFLEKFQSKLTEVSDKDIINKLTSDEAIVSKIANETLLRAQRAVGLRP